MYQSLEINILTSELTFTSYEGKCASLLSWQINSRTGQISFHLHQEWEEMKTQIRELNHMTWSALSETSHIMSIYNANSAWIEMLGKTVMDMIDKSSSSLGVIHNES